LIEFEMSLFKRTPKPAATVIYITASGDKREVAVPIGSSVMEGAVNNGVPGIVAECGGACMCATCHVFVEQTFLDRLEPIAEDEEEMLNNTFVKRQPNSRLSCQIPVTEALEGLTVTTPEAQQ
jgi:2Fe-2S ferredoxin